MPKSRPDGLEDVSEGDYLFHVPTGEVVELVSIDAEWNEEKAWHDGTVTLSVADGGDQTFEEEASDIDFEIHDGEYQPVSDRMLEESDEILLEFARQEVGNYTSRLGSYHDFNGIDGVRIVGDLRAAEFLLRHQERDDSDTS